MKTDAYIKQLEADIKLFLRVGKDCETPKTQKVHDEVLGYFLTQVQNYHEGEKTL